MRLVFLMVPLLLAGCDDAPSPEEQAMMDQRDIAMVEQANRAAEPVQQVTPEPILYPDIERYDLLGKACNYAPGTSLGTRVVARESDAFVKVNGQVMRFAADPGSREMPLGTRSLYNSRTHVLQLDVKGEGEEAAEDKTDYQGTVTLRDRHGRVVYEGTGLAQCNA